MVDIAHILDRNLEAIAYLPAANDGSLSMVLNQDDVPVPVGFRDHQKWRDANIESRCRVGRDELTIKNTSVVTTFIGFNGVWWETWVRRWNTPNDFDDFMWWSDTKELAIEAHRNALLMVLLMY